MVAPEGQRPQEFQPLNQFRIELLDPERLYYALDHSYEIRPEGFIPGFTIGTYKAKDELFSQINVEAMVPDGTYLVRGDCSISVNLKYQDPDDQYWQKDQVQELQRFLYSAYGYAHIERQTNKPKYSLIMEDSIVQLRYVLDLAPENEKTAWEYQVETAYEALTNTNQPDRPLVKMPDEKALKGFMTTRYPILVDSSINIKPINTNHSFLRGLGLKMAEIVDILSYEKTQAVKTFVTKTEKWAKFIEEVVNAMSKVKGIPQSGRLVLLPPSEILQL